MVKVAIIIVASLLVISVVLLVIGYGPRSPGRQKLPASASEIREYRIDLFVDYGYLLKARITQSAFEDYVRNLEMSHTTELEWRTWDSTVPAWWDPSLSSGVVFMSEVGDEVRQAKHENGYVYFQAWSN